MGVDRLTKELKKTLKKARDKHIAKMDELESEDDTCNGSLSDW